MAGIFQNWLNGMRVWFCAKHVLGTIQTLPPPQGARLALMIALYRVRELDVQVPGGFFTISQVVQHPAAYRSELCLAAFNLLRDIRQTSRDEIKSYASFGVSPNPKIKEFTDICDLALSLLMSTIGVGFKPSTLEEVKYAWEQVIAFSPTAADVAAMLNLPERVVNDVIGEPLPTEQWLELARQSPDFLKPAY